MIDSGSEDEEPPIKKTYTKTNSKDVKPDVNKLNKQITTDNDKASATDKNTKDKKPNKETLDRASTSGNSAECNACKEKDTQIKETEKNLKGAEDNLANLRKHVWELMQVIVPDLELDNLEMVDQVVVEMVRVNKQTDGNQTQGNGNNQHENERNSAGSDRAQRNGTASDTSASASEESTTNKRKHTMATNSKHKDTLNGDEIQDPSAETENQPTTGNPKDFETCNNCNGVVEHNEMNGSIANVEIKAEETESQSQSLISNVRSSDGKCTNVKER